MTNPKSNTVQRLLKVFCGQKTQRKSWQTSSFLGHAIGLSSGGIILPTSCITPFICKRLTALCWWVSSLVWEVEGLRVPRYEVIFSGSQKVWKSPDFPLGLIIVLHICASYLLLFNTLENKPAPNLLILMELFSININKYWIRLRVGVRTGLLWSRKSRKSKNSGKQYFWMKYEMTEMSLRKQKRKHGEMSWR